MHLTLLISIALLALKEVKHRISPEKKQLLDAFQGYTSNVVNENLIKLARKCMSRKENQYNLIPFQRIIEMNKVSLAIILVQLVPLGYLSLMIYPVCIIT